MLNRAHQLQKKYCRVLMIFQFVFFIFYLLFFIFRLGSRPAESLKMR